MRRTLVFLLGFWAIAAPTACLALCPDPATAVEIGSTASEQPKAPCHGAAPSDRGAPHPERSSAPESNGDCCLGEKPESIQASAPEHPRAPVVFAFRATSEIASAIAPTVVSPPLLEANRTCTPHHQNNPPLLI